LAFMASILSNSGHNGSAALASTARASMQEA
jgi:hypothetical protein